MVRSSYRLLSCDEKQGDCSFFCTAVVSRYELVIQFLLPTRYQWSAAGQCSGPYFVSTVYQ